jgi:hypothetical protein
LAVVGPSPLRFAPEPPEATERPVPAKQRPKTVAVTPEAIPQEEAPPPEPVKVEPKPEPVAPVKALNILPDDTAQKEVRPEDVLPYFQLPKIDEARGRVMVPFTPAAPTLPPSSATYQQR